MYSNDSDSSVTCVSHFLLRASFGLLYLLFDGRSRERLLLYLSGVNIVVCTP